MSVCVCVEYNFFFIFELNFKFFFFCRNQQAGRFVMANGTGNESKLYPQPNRLGWCVCGFHTVEGVIAGLATAPKPPKNFDSKKRKEKNGRSTDKTKKKNAEIPSAK